MKWRYIGCELKNIPEDLLDDKLMSPNQLKELLKTVPLIDGYLEASDVDVLTSLLINDGIFPLKIHPINRQENKISLLAKLRNKLKNIS